ncbi:uncharacterized protein LOC120848038 [Ixodes scapularis]|uniref:uncharacterized protein LOC120848038 n=1 Tax=Ixodes scapularis TaxID=6945 RepID=UPI001A9DAD29|nr:uncharacterized protein LOC120848038 [Ixodes scapularis]
MKAKMEAFTASTLVFLKGKNVLLNFEELLEEDPGKVALLNLPLVFNEKRQLLFTTEEVRTLTPLIHLEGNEFDIFLDGVLTVRGIRTTVEAVCTLLAVYYIFDVKYPAGLGHTMKFIAHFFFCTLGENISVPVKRFVNFLTV